MGHNNKVGVEEDKIQSRGHAIYSVDENIFDGFNNSLQSPKLTFHMDIKKSENSKTIF